MLTGAIVYRSDLALSVCRWREQHRVPESERRGEKRRRSRREDRQSDRQTGRQEKNVKKKIEMCADC